MSVIKQRLSAVVLFVTVTLLVSSFGSTTVVAQTLNDKQIQEVASTFIKEHAQDLGLSKKEFIFQRTITTRDGLSTVRFGQVISGLPILNSFLAVTLTTEGKFVSINQAVSQNVNPIALQSKPEQIAKIVTDNFSRTKNIDVNSVAIFRLQPVLVDPHLSPGLVSRLTVAWQASVSDVSNAASASRIYISDQSHEIISILGLVKAVTKPNYPTPLVCDLQTSQPSGKLANKISSGLVGTVPRKWVGQISGYPLCEQSDPSRLSSSSPAIKSINETVDFYWDKLGVDIASEYYLGNISPSANFGKNVSAANYCNPAQATAKDASCVPAISGFINVCTYDSGKKSVDCPLENAFWVPWNSTDCRSGACSGIFFGAGFDVADDVVAHELTHGVTGADAFFDGVCDGCDAGGISEALSDIFGEAVDQLNVLPSETPDPNWQMGEDIKGGPFRNMAMVGPLKSCTTTNDWVPIKQIDTTWDTTCDSHTSLGPADRLAWLLANGGKQNGITVLPLGTAPWSTTGRYESCKTDASNCTAIINMARLFFQSLTKLNGNISYSSFGSQLTNACTDLTKARTNPFPASYCVRVKNALAATGISKLSLVLTSRPTSATAQVAVTVAGKFSATNLSPAIGTPVALQFRKANSATWINLKTLNTSTSGLIRTTVTFPSSGSYRLATVSSSQVGKYFSSSVWVTVK